MKESLFDLDGDPGVEREWQNVCETNIHRNPQNVISWICTHMKNNPPYYQKKALEAREIFHKNNITTYDDVLGKMILNCVQHNT